MVKIFQIIAFQISQERIGNQTDIVLIVGRLIRLDGRGEEGHYAGYADPYDRDRHRDFDQIEARSEQIFFHFRHPLSIIIYCYSVAN